MRVIPVAQTRFNDYDAHTETGYECWFESSVGGFNDWDFSEVPKEMDELAEFAGRNCYEAWGRKNPATASNHGYLANILDHGHESVLEHSAVSFYVDGVSRSLLAELSRHRHLSFSVVSQRYVLMNRDRVVVPPMIEKYGHLIARQKMYASWTVSDVFTEAIHEAFDAYHMIADALLAEGLPKKKALEAARSVLPSAVDSPMVVTGNLRAWRDVLKKRWHEDADEEIKRFAGEVLTKLRFLAPNSVQDLPEVPYS